MISNQTTNDVQDKQNKFIKVKEFEKICEIFKHPDLVTSFKIHKKNLSKQQWRILFDNIKKCPSLQNIDLSATNIKISRHNIRNLGEAISGKTIVNLDLSNLKLNDDDIRHLCQYNFFTSKLKTLNLERNKFSDKGLQELAKEFARVKVFQLDLNIAYNKMEIQQESINYLTNFTKLTYVKKNTLIEEKRKSFDPLDNKNLDFLKKFKGKRNKIKTNYLSHEKFLKLIKRLDLANQTSFTITDKKLTQDQWNILLKAIQKCYLLKVLKISNTNIALSDNENLRNLGIAIKGKGIVSLNLSKNYLNDDHIKALCFPEKNNAKENFTPTFATILTFIDLDHNNISDVGIKALSDSLIAARVFNINLNVSENKIVYRKAVLHDLLTLNRKIKSLNLFGNPISNKGLNLLVRGLKKNTSLEELNLGKCQFIQVEKGKEENEMKGNDKNKNNFYGFKQFCQIYHFTNIRSLVLSYNNLTDEHMIDLAPLFSGLVNLDISHNKVCLARKKKENKENKKNKEEKSNEIKFPAKSTVKKLDLSYNNINNKAIPGIAPMNEETPLYVFLILNEAYNALQFVNFDGNTFNMGGFLNLFPHVYGLPHLVKAFYGENFFSRYDRNLLADEENLIKYEDDLAYQCALKTIKIWQTKDLFLGALALVQSCNQSLHPDIASYVILFLANYLNLTDRIPESFLYDMIGYVNKIKNNEECYPPIVFSKDTLYIPPKVTKNIPLGSSSSSINKNSKKEDCSNWTLNRAESIYYNKYGQKETPAKIVKLVKAQEHKKIPTPPPSSSFFQRQNENKNKNKNKKKKPSRTILFTDLNQKKEDNHPDNNNNNKII